MHIDHVSIFIIIVGAAIIISRGWLAKMSVASQKIAWGFKFGEREEMGGAIVVGIIGIGIIIFGFLRLFKILE